MRSHPICWVVAVILASCAASEPAPQSPSPAAAGEPPPSSVAERKALKQDECEAQGGTIRGDIGDGATQRADYVCPSGKPPLGNIAPPAGGPISVEGGVCCPQ